MKDVSHDDTSFELNLNPKLVRTLINSYSKSTSNRYKLPDDWRTSFFSYFEFKNVFIAIQAILYGRFIARSILARNGMKGMGYSSAVWVVTYSELAERLALYTRVNEKIIKKILSYLTFGNQEIRCPDIALQPLVDLENGFFALSPFVWINSNVERNFCALLNQIPNEKNIYSKLTQMKEGILRDDIVKYVEDLGYEVAYGELGNTDLDIAIIDRQEKICICLELKWFIEPAEVREGFDRAKELKTGVSQSKKIQRHHKNNFDRLNKDILKIDSSYEFAVAVGSRNWIGDYGMQDVDVPIIKVWHLLENIKKFGSLRDAKKWLVAREYIPKKGTDYEILPTELTFGKWTSSWYEIRLIENGAVCK
jgi:hypothetical protein